MNALDEILDSIEKITDPNARMLCRMTANLAFKAGVQSKIPISYKERVEHLLILKAERIVTDDITKN